MRNIQTLHSHTINSDGELTHRQVLKVCEQNNIGVIAFTDHDGVLGEKEIAELRSYKGPVKWISGIEISSGLPKELGGGPASDFHIVGLFVDPTNTALAEHCKLAQKARVDRMQKMVKNLVDLGFSITEEDCLRASGGEAVARPHIVTAIKSKASNLKIIENMRLKMEEEAKSNADIKIRYNLMMEQGENQYPYKLFLAEDAYIPNVYVDYQYSTDMDTSVKLIREAGGVAILAHYFTVAKKINREMLDQFLMENRLDGAETVYGLFAMNTGTEIEKYLKETEIIAKELVEKNDKVQSGGADAHKEKDFIMFSNSGDYAKRTESFAQNIISKLNINTKWSNF